MVRKVEWTNQALKDRFQILSYWINRNKSNRLSIKLDNLFIEALQLLCKFPNTGKSTVKPNVRIKVVKSYLLVYKIIFDKIVVLRIWDSRQNPEKLKYEIEELL